MIINILKTVSNKKSIAEGPVGELDPVKDDLLDRFMVVITSCMLLPALMEKGEQVVYKLATGFLLATLSCTTWAQKRVNDLRKRSVARCSISLRTLVHVSAGAIHISS